MGKKKDKRMYIEKPSCWRLFGFLGWATGLGGLLLVVVGGLSIYRPDISITLDNWILLLIGISSLAMAIISIFLRPQWTVTLMELRAMKKRLDNSPSKEEFISLSEMVVSLMESFESINEETQKKDNLFQRETRDSLIYFKASFDKLQPLLIIGDKLIAQEKSIKAISASLEEIEDLLSKRSKSKEPSSKKDNKRAIEEEIREDNDRLMYV